MKTITGIFLTLAIMFANGVCPCGLALQVQGLLQPFSSHRVVAFAAPAGCPMCQHDRRSSDSSNNQPVPNRCSQMVSGDVPAPAIGAPSHDLNCTLLVSIQPAVIHVAVFQQQQHPPAYSSSPPPTLVGLSCCFNI
jgi:hypothetical protein